MHTLASLSAILVSYHVGMGPHLLTAMFSSMATVMYLKKGFETESLSTTRMMVDTIYHSENCRTRVKDGNLITEFLHMGAWESRLTVKSRNTDVMHQSTQADTELPMGMDIGL